MFALHYKLAIICHGRGITLIIRRDFLLTSFIIRILKHRYIRLDNSKYIHKMILNILLDRSTLSRICLKFLSKTQDSRSGLSRHVAFGHGRTNTSRGIESTFLGEGRRREQLYSSIQRLEPKTRSGAEDPVTFQTK
jgi:hypothetical protein